MIGMLHVAFYASGQGLNVDGKHGAKTDAIVGTITQTQNIIYMHAVLGFATLQRVACIVKWGQCGRLA